MANSKKENKACFIINSISSLLFIISGVSIFVEKGISEWSGITDIALGITFGSLAYLYFKKYKEEK